uniref:Uncharacterized protein n=1 Tax=Oryza barthii TaxID=65489 RepID=A0A0D3HD10_9ORYZ
MASDMDSGKPSSGVAINQACPTQCHGQDHSMQRRWRLNLLWAVMVWFNLILPAVATFKPILVVYGVDRAPLGLHRWRLSSSFNGGADQPPTSRNLPRDFFVQCRQGKTIRDKGCITPPKILYILGCRKLIVPIAVKPPKLSDNRLMLMLTLYTASLDKHKLGSQIINCHETS